MSEQQIQSLDISVADLFQSFYVVPDYQREFVWTDAEVEQLLSDVLGAMGDSSPGKEPEYFIGSIVVCPGKDELLELIDGQQRMTTLFVTLCGIRDHINLLGDGPLRVLDNQIAAFRIDASGQEVSRNRLDLQYDDSGKILERIAAGEDLSGGDHRTRSMTNIRSAYDAVRQFLTASFEDLSAVRRYYAYLTNKVKLIRIHTVEVGRALKIFETINDRGVGLDAMDLLKNLLFMKANSDEFGRLKTAWKELQDTLYELREKPLRFLRYFIFSRYDVDTLREDAIYDWFSKNECLCGYSAAPVQFATELIEAAKAYGNFLRGRYSDGRKSRYLENMRILGGRAARQHLILLLAGRHLSRELFDRLCRDLENLFFCYVITREPTRAFERDFAAWAKEVRSANSEEDLNIFLRNRFDSAKAELAARFGSAFERLTTESLQRYRLRYVLAKFSQWVELAAFGETEETRWLSIFVSRGYEVEHIFPQTPSENAQREFGTYDSDSRVAEKLGNLVLVEKSINSSLGNRAYSEKKDVYAQSKLLLTRSLATKPHIGVNTKIDAAVAEFDAFEVWSERSIASRQSKLTEVAHRVWDVEVQPVAGASSELTSTVS
ncbi:MAG: DUF262 domain-containing protein [Chloroflexi bacterium]|nr:DUF262 domain-containing protein [Chloroflexota bacterium]